MDDNQHMGTKRSFQDFQSIASGLEDEEAESLASYVEELVQTEYPHLWYLLNEEHQYQTSQDAHVESTISNGLTITHDTPQQTSHLPKKIMKDASVQTTISYIQPMKKRERWRTAQSRLHPSVTDNNTDTTPLGTPIPYDPSLVQIKSGPREIRTRMKAFMDAKREDNNEINTRQFTDFYRKQKPDDTSARSSTHPSDANRKYRVRVTRVFAQEGPQENQNLVNLPEGVETRVKSMENYLNVKFTSTVPPTVYQRLKMLEDRILDLENNVPKDALQKKLEDEASFTYLESLHAFKQKKPRGKHALGRRKGEDEVDSGNDLPPSTPSLPHHTPDNNNNNNNNSTHIPHITPEKMQDKYQTPDAVEKRIQELKQLLLQRNEEKKKIKKEVQEPVQEPPPPAVVTQ